MSKQVRSAVAVVVCAGVVGLVLLAGVHAQDGGGSFAPTHALFTETSRIRELPILRPVKSASASRADIERFTIRKFDAQTTPAEVRAAELTLKKLGVVPPNFDYRSFFAALMSEQVAGAYDPQAGQLQLPDWLDLAAQEPVLIHELTHALQDQHFDLRRLEQWPKGDSDAQLAAHSLAEGDAMLTMTHYLLTRPGAAVALLASLNVATPTLDRAPAVLRESLGFPYQHGLLFVSALHKQGGWPAVSAAYKKLPLSTEHVLHYEKYQAYEPPVSLVVPDIASQLGQGWTRLDGDVHGEWSYYLLLNEFLNSPDEAARAAAGWGGDRYALYAGPARGQALLVQQTAWDTANDAAEFYDAYVKRTGLRYRGAKPFAVAAPVEGRRHAWQTSEGLVVLESRGSRVLILEGVPPSANPADLLRALWH